MKKSNGHIFTFGFISFLIAFFLLFGLLIIGVSKIESPMVVFNEKSGPPVGLKHFSIEQNIVKNFSDTGKIPGSINFAKIDPGSTPEASCAMHKFDKISVVDLNSFAYTIKKDACGRQYYTDTKKYNSLVKDIKNSVASTLKNGSHYGFKLKHVYNGFSIIKATGFKEALTNPISLRLYFYNNKLNILQGGLVMSSLLVPIFTIILIILVLKYILDSYYKKRDQKIIYTRFKVLSTENYTKFKDQKAERKKKFYSKIKSKMKIRKKKIKDD